MITIQGNRQIIKSAQLLESKARNIYPHLSTSRIKLRFNQDEQKPEYYQALANKITKSRKMIRNSHDFYSSVIYALQELKIGNCTEEAIFAELLGRINGQNNIYSGSIFINDVKKNKKMLNHAVAFITDKNIENGKDIFLKNKDAIIIDPWLNITDFAGSYYTKIMSTFRDIFKNLPKTNPFLNALAKAESKTPKEFNNYIREYDTPIKLSITPFIDNTLKNTPVEYLREFFPELTIKNYKKINLT